MKIITHKEIVELNISQKDCFKWVKDVIKNKKEDLLPAKISMKPMPGVFCNVMPSIVKVDNKMYGGVKMVTRYPERTPSLDSQIILFDAETGQTLGFIDANWITAMRTGSVAAYSIKLFAKNDYKEIGIMGLGNTARSTFLSLLENVILDKKIKVKLLKYKGQEKLFEERFSSYKNVEFIYVDTVEELVQNSDIIISAATYLPDNVCEKEELYKEGVLVVPIHTLGFTNCDLFFDKVFTDDYDHVKGFKYFDKFKKFAEVTDVVNDKIKGRENDKERILIYNIGVSIQDIYFAAKIYEKLNAKGKLTDINLEPPIDKFWV